MVDINIKKETVVGVNHNGLNQYDNIPDGFYNIRLTEIVPKINIVDGSFLKYLPDEMLNEEQIKSKNIALEKERKKEEDLKNGIRKQYSFKRDDVENPKAPSLNTKAARHLRYAANRKKNCHL